ncbi:MFS transporter [Streptomyces sp. NPDC050560]|uniref:MFS transporter n=1 Tax=Streptomyces sp. NPDC050560 TaxID=3365630 RepID=UPI003797F6BD
MATAEATGAVAPAWRGGFGRLWSAAVLSRLGDGLRGAALPLLAASLTDRPLLIAAVSACGYLPWLLFGLLGGAVADRVDQRRAMWGVDLLRGALMAAFAAAVALGHAAIALLIALAFALTTLQTLFDNAATALLPGLVAPAELAGANARLLTGQQMAGGLLGAPLVPALAAVGAGAPFAVDALTFLAAAALVASLRTAPPERAPRAPGSTLRRETAEGLRALWRDRALRGLCTATALCNIGMGALIATLVVLVTRWLAAGPGGYAAALAAYTVGGVAGGLAGRRLLARRPLRAILAAGAVQTAALTAMGTLRSLPALVAAMACFGFMGMVWNIGTRTLMQQRSPTAMLGRISAAFRTVSVSGAPLGALVGGALAGASGANVPPLFAAALFLPAVLALIPAARSPDGPGGGSTGPLIN